MSSLEPADRVRLRASDADRHAVGEILREAAGDGRLTLDELDDRLTAAANARTYADLDRLVADLPIESPPGTGVLRLSAPVSDVKRSGRWDVPAHLVASAGLGSIKLDFTEAAVRHRVVTVEARAHVGSVVLVVPPEWRVDVDSVQPGVGSVKNKLPGPGDPNAPLLRVVGHVAMGDIVVRPPRSSRFLPR